MQPSSRRWSAACSQRQQLAAASCCTVAGSQQWSVSGMHLVPVIGLRTRMTLHGIRAITLVCCR